MVIRSKDMPLLERRRMRLLLTVGTLSTVGVGGVSGCAYDDSCYEERLCLTPPKSLCDGEPATAMALDECGVFVSEQGDDTSPGTKEAPVKTLQHAIGLATHGPRNGQAATRRVYACGGLFEEAIALPSGVDLWGGRLCGDGGWWYEGSFDRPDHPTTIAPPVGIPLQVIQGEGISTIFGVRVLAAEASAEDRKSSIAMILNHGAKARVMSSDVIAGNGKDGEAGKDAPSFRAMGGVEGNDGASACTADAAMGALPVVTVCDDGIESTGGYGGDGGLDVGGDGAPGRPEPAENPEDFGGAGLGAGSDPCTRGKDGAPGTSRGRAGGALGEGYLNKYGWIGVLGEDGETGGVGQAGGGGGGSKSRGPMYACPTSQPQSGAAGGSGGSGGCGGKGGWGGGYGGASIAIVALEDTELELAATLVVAGNGGKGGVGGTGQLGGIGKAGGDGGHGEDTRMWGACDGGWGGDGGRGGDAGGGLGGASVGIAYVVPHLAILPGTTIEVGGAGDGGYAGGAGIDDEVGQGGPGPSAPIYPFGAANELPR
ncbi:hypothetical protein [Sorangium sp. So ce1151]|uniref:hypothetical protein n=1 Tax=Sorangium sp. So ce1151 TaxID=3133332 RepID=UPI003F6369EC